MTTVTLFCSSGRLCGFLTRGHAGYDEPGKDIVCSAISALTISAVNGITTVLGLDAAVEADNGEMYCMLPAGISASMSEKASIVLETMALGLRSIADSYGDYIKISEREV